MGNNNELMTKLHLAWSQLQTFKQLIQQVQVVCPTKDWHVEPERGVYWMELWVDRALVELQGGRGFENE